MDSAAGGEPWTSFPEGAHRALQPGSLGRNCANEKVGLSEDYIWYRRTLFSWRLALVGRTSQKKGEVRERLGCIISKDRQGNWSEAGPWVKGLWERISD